MTALGSYSTGTVSVAVNGTVVTGAGTIWSSTNARPGDILQIGNLQTIITDVTDTGTLVIPPWGGAAQVGAAYKIWQWLPQRVTGADIAQSVNVLVGALNTTGFFFFVDVSLTAPDPSLGSNGQYALQPATGKTWVKSGGAWSYLGIYKGLSFTGNYDPARTYSPNDVATSAGSSFVWTNLTPGAGHPPPDVSYWQVLAQKGDTGATGAVPWAIPTVNWATATAYVAAAPASLITGPNGNVYQCIVAHTSTTFTADLAAAKWKLIAQSLKEATSTSSVAIGIGAKTFNALPDLSYQNGVRLRVSSNGTPTAWMEGIATYVPSTGAISMTVDKINGSGTFTDWNFNRCGQPGSGDLSSANNLSDVANPATALINLGGVSFAVAQALSAAQSDQARKNILAFGKINLIMFGASQTYTPSANLLGVLVECIGGGGAGGGVAAAGAQGYVLCAAGGGAGGRSIRFLTAAQIAAAGTIGVTIGAGGLGVSAGTGGSGGGTSFGSLCAGAGGAGAGYVSTGQMSGAGPGGTASNGTGDLKFNGNAGQSGHYQSLAAQTNIIITRGKGGDSSYGPGGTEVVGNSVAYGANGNPGGGFGAGGSGAISNQQNASNFGGGNGYSGLCLVTEFLAA